MLNERVIKTCATMEPAWNDLREQRVLGRVLEARRQEVRRTRRMIVTGSAVTTLATAAAVVWLVLRPHDLNRSKTPSIAVVPASAHLTLIDGSEATMAPDARVEVIEQRPDRVRLTQSSGAVHYEVTHDPSRSFVVRAGDVEVRVRGTSFTVTLDQGWVSVRVQRGRVQVDDGARATELTSGEELRVASVRAPPAPVEPTVGATDDNDEPDASTGLHARANSNHHPSVSDPNDRALVTVSSLLERVDRDRASGNLDDAAASLSTLIDRFPHDPQVTAAYFTLGRVERSRGHHAAAAEAFSHCRTRDPRGSLAEDSLSEEATSWLRAGQSVRARESAEQYLRRYPTGSQAARMRTLTE